MCPDLPFSHLVSERTEWKNYIVMLLSNLKAECIKARLQRSIVNDADVVTRSHRGTRTDTKTQTLKARHTLQSSFPGCTRRGLCPHHNSVKSCQDASPLAAEYSFSVMGADRDCTGKLGPWFVYVCKFVFVCTHAELNEIYHHQSLSVLRR